MRDNIHSIDVARFIEQFIEAPCAGEVYKIGGGRANSCSILEAFEMAREVSGRESAYDYNDIAREGDHICYISDLGKAIDHYPGWSITRDLATIFEEISVAWQLRLAT